MANGSVYLAVLLGLCLSFSSVSAITDVDILNFALNLEYLEAEFYSWAAFGHGLSPADRGYGPAPIGGKKAVLHYAAQKYADAIAADEINHVRFLRAALGKLAVPAPLIDIGPAFAMAADAAFNATLSPPFSPYASDVAFYLGSFIFEDVGVTAYHGAAPLIQNKDYLLAAAGILGTEAYHAGAIRAILLSYGDSVKPYGATIAQVAQAISNLRDAADGPGDDDQGIVVNSNPVLAPGDLHNHITFARSAAQVLPIVYLGGMTKGGFFPNGLNGNIK